MVDDYYSTPNIVHLGCMTLAFIASNYPLRMYLTMHIHVLPFTPVHIVTGLYIVLL